MLYRTTYEGRGLATLAPGGYAARPAYGVARGGCGPRTRWSRSLPPIEGGGPGCFAANRRQNISGMLGIGPPPPRWAAAGYARRPCLVSGLRSRPGPLGLRPAGPGSGPLRSLRVATGVAPAYRRAACARRGGAAAPPAGAAAAAPVPAGGGFATPPASVPSSGGLVRVALVACRPLTGPLRSWRRPSCAPSLVAPGPPLPPPAGRPGFRHGPPPLPPSGGRLGRLRRPSSPPPPPSVGIIRPSACRQGLRTVAPSWGHP